MLLVARQRSIPVALMACVAVDVARAAIKEPMIRRKPRVTFVMKRQVASSLPFSDRDSEKGLTPGVILNG